MGRLETLARWLLPATAPGRVLAPGESLTLERAAEVILAGSALDVPIADVAKNVEEFLRRGRSRRAWRVRALLVLIEVAPLSTHGRPFSRLTFAERSALVRSKWAGGAHVWRLCAKVRNLVILGAYGDARAAGRTGYVPVPQRPRFRATSLPLVEVA